MYDVIVQNGLWFDGTGAPPLRRSLGIKAGRLTTVSTEPLDENQCDHVVDAEGQWVLPGFVDVHTHYDAEVLLDPGLRESVRHGVTTVIIGNCSLSTVYSSPEDAADLFSRVEAVPHEYVLAALRAKADWTTPQEYVDTLESLPLGPNVASMLGHSDLRATVLGLDRATSPDVVPTAAERSRMADLLKSALDAGMVGMSSMDAPMDKLDGDRYRSRALPSTFARWVERRMLCDVLREHNRVLQSAPDPAKLRSLLLHFWASRSRFSSRAALRTTLLVAADAKSMPGCSLLTRLAPRIGNALFGSAIRMQHLPIPLELYSDGIDLPVFEEFGAGTAALHIRDQLARNNLLADAGYRRQFRRELKRKRMVGLWHRDFHDAVIVECPDKGLIGRSFGELADDKGIDQLDAFLDVLIANGERNVRWTTVLGNHRPHQLARFAKDPNVHMGFSDAGAHLRNMANYNFSLRMLERVHKAAEVGEQFMNLEHAVHRLTGELGAWFGIDAGTLRLGDRADFVVVDPTGLNGSTADYAEAEVAFYGGLRRMVRRNDAAVTATAVNGNVVSSAANLSTAIRAKPRAATYERSTRHCTSVATPVSSSWTNTCRAEVHASRYRSSSGLQR